MTKFVLVQHSGYGYGSDPQFRYGLESRMVTARQAERAAAAGAVIYESYVAAEDAAMAMMYPPDHKGMTPVANRVGDFAKAKVDGLNLFIIRKEQKNAGQT